VREKGGKKKKKKGSSTRGMRLSFGSARVSREGGGKKKEGKRGGVLSTFHSFFFTFTRCLLSGSEDRRKEKGRGRRERTIPYFSFLLAIPRLGGKNGVRCFSVLHVPLEGSIVPASRKRGEGGGKGQGGKKKRGGKKKKEDPLSLARDFLTENRGRGKEEKGKKGTSYLTL